MGKYPVAVLDEVSALEANPAVNGNVFLDDATGLSNERLLNISHRSGVCRPAASHPFDCPEEVSRRRTCPGEFFTYTVKSRFEFLARRKIYGKGTKREIGR